MGWCSFSRGIEELKVRCRVRCDSICCEVRYTICRVRYHDDITLCRNEGRPFWLAGEILCKPLDESFRENRVIEEGIDDIILLPLLRELKLSTTTTYIYSAKSPPYTKSP